jgi:hypothetical protein
VVLNFPDWLWVFEQSQKTLAFDLFPRGLFEKTAPAPFTHQMVNRSHQIAGQYDVRSHIGHPSFRIDAQWDIHNPL